MPRHSANALNLCESPPIMTREEALAALTASVSTKRYTAAHRLIEVGEADDLKALLHARSLERDAYVLARLDAAISVCAAKRSHVESVQPIETDSPEFELFKKAKSEAVEWITGLLLHEIGPKIGRVALAASEEVPNYEQSRTKQRVAGLQTIFEGIQALKDATTSAKVEQFDLADLVEEVVSQELQGGMLPPSLVGMRPAVVTTDRRILTLALCNGIRNAIEAVKENPSLVTNDGTINDAAPVVVTWGMTDIECWVSVIDRGNGLVGSVTTFDIGRTSKIGHIGFGLAMLSRQWKP